MNVLVESELTEEQLGDVSALLARCERADGHPALAEPQRAAVARRDLGGQGARAVLGYNGPDLAGCAILTPTPDEVTALHVAVDPAYRTEPIRTELIRTELIRTELIRSALAQVGVPVRLWLMQATEADDAEAAALGFRPERDLLQMRVPLPLRPETVARAHPVPTRPFRLGRDDEAWLAVNNRAFAGHPEQGRWTLEDLHERTSAEWFDAAGFLVADAADGSGLIGSCWTKVHRHSEPVLGEIYVISVDPSRHGEGWGKALTVAGLQWMADRGIQVGMLYTTASNTAAVSLYRSLGFAVDHIDRSYLLS